MKFIAFEWIAICIVGIGWSAAPMQLAAGNCKCPKNPGPGGGVRCADDQIATCDPSSGECNCTCDSIARGKSKEEYEAIILSKALRSTVDPADLSSPQYHRFVSSFRKGEDQNSFSFEKDEGSGRSVHVRVGVPEWVGSVLGGKGAVLIGPGAYIQNCPNGICISGDNKGGATVNNFGPLPLPTPTVKVCVSYSATPAGEHNTTVISLSTDVQIVRPWFAFFFDGPVMDGTATIGNGRGVFGYIHGRADKLPNPENTFLFRLNSIDFASVSWFPSNGVIKITVPSQGHVKLINVMGGAGDDPDAQVKENLVFNCD